MKVPEFPGEAGRFTVAELCQFGVHKRRWSRQSLSVWESAHGCSMLLPVLHLERTWLAQP